MNLAGLQERLPTTPRIDALDPYPLEARFAGLFHILGPFVDAQELALGSANIPEFCRDDQLVAVVRNGATKQFLVFPNAVHIRSVREIYTQ